jgi:dephospho-CoA kinase
MILGITGGFGTGKSTAARLFEERGYRRIDSDQLIRDQVLTSPEVVAALATHFGPEVLTGLGKVNRRKVADRVFTNDTERVWLEELTHPPLFALWREALRLAPDGLWVVEVPLLFEKSLQKWFDFIVCVACAPEQQLVRLEQCGINRTFAEQRLSKQLPLAKKIELSDFVLWNEGSPEFLKAQVDRLVDSLA